MNLNDMPQNIALPRLQRGDRVRIKDDYENAGTVGYYVGKANDEDGKVVVYFPSPYVGNTFLADAIEPYPYTREERIERAIEDVEWGCGQLILSHNERNLLFAIIDAEV